MTSHFALPKDFNDIVYEEHETLLRNFGNYVLLPLYDAVQKHQLAENYGFSQITFEKGLLYVPSSAFS
jgi:hypothetical protein